jgi:Mce-associated membrane protein
VSGVERRVLRGPTRLTIGLCAALLVLLAAAVVLAVMWSGARGDAGLRQAEQEAQDAAETYAVDLTTYDYSSLDQDYAWVDDGATASFAKEYAEANKPLRKVIATLKARATGSVTASAATARSDHEATVLLFVDQTIVNGTDSKKRAEHNRVVMTMVERDGRWLVDKVALR